MRLVIAQVVALSWRMFLLMLFVLVRPKEETSTKRGDPAPSHRITWTVEARGSIIKK